MSVNESAGHEQLACGACQSPLSGHYFKAGEAILCDACRFQYEMEQNERSELTCFAKAGAFGLVAALGGAALWGGVIWITEYELGLIAIIVGLMVGAAVKAGSGGRGGRPYQIMAVGFTYLAVTLAYVPLVIQGFRHVAEEEAAALAEPEGEISLPSLEIEMVEATAPAQPSAEAALAPGTEVAPDTELTAAAFVAASLAVLGIAAAVPFLAGFENAIGLLIIGFALWEAWKINARVDLPASGPHRVGES